MSTTAKDSFTEWARKVVSTLAGLAILFVLMFGAWTTFRPSPYPAVLGYVCLVIAVVVLLRMTHRWVKIAPGVFGLAALSGVLRTLSGRLGENTSNIEALTLVALLIVGAVLTNTFVGRRHTAVDRVALVAVVIGAALGMTLPTAKIQTAAFMTGILCVLSAWGWHRLQRRNSGLE